MYPGREKKGQYKEGLLQSWDPKTEKTAAYLSASTVCEVHTLLSTAMKQALRWKLIAENPIPDEGPKKRHVERTIWDEETMFKALSLMRDPFVHLAVHCSYMGSLREGEAMGIPISNIKLEYKGVGCIIIDRTLQRVSKKSLETVGREGIVFEFPEQVEDAKSVLVLKYPKTESSRRIIYLTGPLRAEIMRRLRQIEHDKKIMGTQYHDYGLLFCQPNGLPVEPSLCRKRFDRWKAEQAEEFPPMVFHGIRHSSSTYKLLLSDGDIKSVQGDTGHSKSQVLLDVYAHSQEKARMALTKKVEQDFYQDFAPQRERTQENPLMDLLAQAISDEPQMQKLLLETLLAQNAHRAREARG